MPIGHAAEPLASTVANADRRGRPGTHSMMDKPWAVLAPPIVDLSCPHRGSWARRAVPGDRHRPRPTTAGTEPQPAVAAAECGGGGGSGGCGGSGGPGGSGGSGSWRGLSSAVMVVGRGGSTIGLDVRVLARRIQRLLFGTRRAVVRLLRLGELRRRRSGVGPSGGMSIPGSSMRRTTTVRWLVEDPSSRSSASLSRITLLPATVVGMIAASDAAERAGGPQPFRQRMLPE
jgi:hypothetical protein